jgi:cytochrome b6-f complex iron-sulfur subunit
MDRRKFLNWVGLGALATSLPVAIAACQSETPTSESDTAPSDAEGSLGVGETRDDGSYVIGTVSELDDAGFLKGRPAFASGSVIVVKSPDSPDTLFAVDDLCTHQGCSVDWEASDPGFTCACHGSAFAVDGAVTSGPATEPLPTYSAMVDGDVVVVQPS